MFHLVIEQTHITLGPLLQFGFPSWMVDILCPQRIMVLGISETNLFRVQFPLSRELLGQRALDSGMFNGWWFPICDVFDSPSYSSSSHLLGIWASLVAQRVKRLPARRETSVQSLGGEDPLEKEMATHSSTLAWRILWTEESGRLKPTGSQRVGHDWAISHFHTMDFQQDWIQGYCSRGFGSAQEWIMERALVLYLD